MHENEETYDPSSEVGKLLSQLPRGAGLHLPEEEREALLASLRQQAMPLESGFEFPREEEQAMLKALKSIPQTRQRGLLRGLWIPLAAAASIAAVFWLWPFANQADSPTHASLENLQFDSESLDLLLEERNDYELLFEKQKGLNLENIDEASLLAYVIEHEEDFNDHWYELEIE